MPSPAMIDVGVLSAHTQDMIAWTMPDAEPRVSRRSASLFSSLRQDSAPRLDPGERGMDAGRHSRPPDVRHVEALLVRYGSMLARVEVFQRACGAIGGVLISRSR